MTGNTRFLHCQMTDPVDPKVTSGSEKSPRHPTFGRTSLWSHGRVNDVAVTCQRIKGSATTFSYPALETLGLKAKKEM